MNVSRHTVRGLALALCVIGASCTSTPAEGGARGEDKVAMDEHDAAHAHYVRYLAGLGMGPAGITEERALARGGFFFFTAPDAPGAWVSEKGVLGLDGSGDWAAFVTAHGDAAKVADALARAMNRGATAVLDPASPSVAKLPPEGRKHVSPPTLTREPDGATTLTFWFGQPPAFGPSRLSARIAEATTITVTSLDALVSPSDEEAVWLRHLASEDPQARKLAAVEVGKRKLVRAVPGLVALLSDPWADARKAAVAALVQIGDAQAAQGLVAALLGEQDAGVGVEIAAALGKLGGPESKQGLLRASKESKVELIRSHAAYWAGQLP